MIVRFLTAICLIPLVVVSIFYLPFPYFAGLLSVILLLALREWASMLGRFGGTLYLCSYPLIGLVPWLSCYYGALSTPYVVISLLIILSWSVFATTDTKDGYISVAGNVLAFAYLGIPFSILSTYHPRSVQGLAETSRGLELLLVLGVVWLSDAAAYFVGRRYGRHKVTPLISPNKSLEGYLAGLLFPAALTPLLGPFLLPHRSVTFLFSAGLALAVFGSLGDLFESILKRGAGIKDSSHLVPGHGGVLDRLDSLLFALPAYYLLAKAFEPLER